MTQDRPEATDDDGFFEILPEDGKAPKAPLTIKCLALGRDRKSRKVSLIFRLSLLDADTRAILENGPRFAIAFNPAMRAIRIKAQPMGRYELLSAPGGRGGPKSEEVKLMRFPFPPSGMLFAQEIVGLAEPDPNRQQGTVLIDLPPCFHPAPITRVLPAPGRPAALAPPARSDLTPGLMGDPAPGRFTRGGR